MAWTAETIKSKLEEDDKWLIRGLLAICRRQTLEEQNSEITKNLNNIGFNKFDASFLTSLAKSFLKWKSLTPKQMRYCRKKMTKYSSQLSKIANGEI